MVKKLLAGISGGLLLTLSVPMVAFAASSQVIVTPTNQQGWSTADTRPGGTVTFSSDTTAPGNPHNGALQLTTDATTTAKAQYLHEANVSIANVTELSYYTKQISGPPHAAASYQFIVDLNGAAPGGFTTFVYEPYQNGVVTPGIWQSWDVDAGQFWSSRSFSSGTCTVVAGGGGAPFYTLAGLQTSCPDAVAIGFGVNIGSNNPAYNVETDLVNFNGTTYNFEPTVQLSNKNQCKNGDWQNSNTPVFKNQGDCVSHFASNGRSN